MYTYRITVEIGLDPIVMYGAANSIHVAIDKALALAKRRCTIEPLPTISVIDASRVGYFDFDTQT